LSQKLGCGLHGDLLQWYRHLNTAEVRDGEPHLWGTSITHRRVLRDVRCAPGARAVTVALAEDQFTKVDAPGVLQVRHGPESVPRFIGAHAAAGREHSGFKSRVSQALAELISKRGGALEFVREEGGAGVPGLRARAVIRSAEHGGARH
jgi:hypothetical protein